LTKWNRSPDRTLICGADDFGDGNCWHGLVGQLRSSGDWSDVEGSTHTAVHWNRALFGSMKFLVARQAIGAVYRGASPPSRRVWHWDLFEPCIARSKSSGALAGVAVAGELPKGIHLISVSRIRIGGFEVAVESERATEKGLVSAVAETITGIEGRRETVKLRTVLIQRF